MTLKLSHRMCIAALLTVVLAVVAACSSNSKGVTNSPGNPGLSGPPLNGVSPVRAAPRTD